MGKNKPNPKAVAARKAEQTRKKRSRLIMILIVVVAALAVVGITIGMILSTKSSNPMTNGEYDELISADRGFTITSSGPATTPDAKPSESKHTVELYFDYSCSHCAQFEGEYGEQLLQGARDGKYKLQLHPVDTQGRFFPYAYTAVDLAARVYSSQPEKFTELHTALSDAMLNAVNSQNQDDIAEIQSETKSLELTKKIAKDHGVSQDIIDRVSHKDGMMLLTTMSQEWGSEIKAESLATPMVVIDGKVIETTDQAMKDIAKL
ncbi:MAG: thioredoxin domain-containing protein [Varibaculum sp.]|nr:thioredoxin domain-containing protein [Varibaculum sp.]